MLTVVLLAAAAFPALQEPKTGSIQVTAFDNTGGQIESEWIEADLFNSDGKKLPEAFHNGVAENVPYGDYLVVVWSPGFKSERRNLSLHLPRVIYHFTLEVGSIAD